MSQVSVKIFVIYSKNDLKTDVFLSLFYLMHIEPAHKHLYVFLKLLYTLRVYFY